MHALAEANGLQPGDRLHAGQKLRVGSGTLAADSGSGSSRGAHSARVSAAVAAAPAGETAGRRVLYRVRRGDTLYSIARLLQVTVIDLVGWNRMSGDRSIHPGQTLVAFVRSRS